MDLQKIVNDLLNTGLTQTELADQVGCSQSLIASYGSGARGARPSFEFASKLLALHDSRCKQRRKRQPVGIAPSPP